VMMTVSIWCVLMCWCVGGAVLSIGSRHQGNPPPPPTGVNRGTQKAP
jgi:hypothetical protein